MSILFIASEAMRSELTISGAQHEVRTLTAFFSPNARHIYPYEFYVLDLVNSSSCS